MYFYAEIILWIDKSATMDSHGVGLWKGIMKFWVDFSKVLWAS